MNENMDLGISWLTTGVAASSVAPAANVAAGFNTVLQYVIVALPVLAALVSIAYTLYKWVKRATADKKISQEEVDELMAIIEDGSKEIAKVIPTEDNPNE